MDKETSLGKALRLLFAVGESADPAGISVVEIIETTGLSRPTAYRYLNQLQQFGLVRSVPKQPIWQLGPKVIALAAQSGSWSTLRRRAKQAMEEYVRAGGPTVHLGIRDGSEVVYIDKAESVHFATISSVIGQRRSVHVTALGKALVAFDADPGLAKVVAKDGLKGRTANTITTKERWLEEIQRVRDRGVAYDLGECDIGASCVAAPIRDSQNYAVAAISVSALSAQPGDIDFTKMETEIRALADQISQMI